LFPQKNHLKNKKAAWLFGLAASIICISFLKLQVIIKNEARHYNPHPKLEHATGFGFQVA
jgi:hypothetical protein